METYIKTILDSIENKTMSRDEFYKLRNEKYAKGVEQKIFEDDDNQFEKFDILLGDYLNVKW